MDNQTANGWNDLCNGSQNPGDYCADVGVSSLSLATVPGNSYYWWVHACNSTGCSAGATGPGFTCTASYQTPTYGYQYEYEYQYEYQYEGQYGYEAQYGYQYQTPPKPKEIQP